MSFASTAKRRLPWLDTTRLERAEQSQHGNTLPDAICDLVITLFEELSAQSRERAIAELMQKPAAELTTRTPLLGPGDE